MFCLAHDEVRPQETGAAAATVVGVHLRSSVVAIVKLGFGAVSTAHLGPNVQRT